MSSPSNSTIFYVRDTSVSGTWILFAIAVGVIGTSLFVYEIMRRRDAMKRIFYPRMKALAEETPEFPEKYFGWIFPAIQREESFYLQNIGMDSVMFLRFLQTNARICGILGLIICPVLIPLHYYAQLAQTTSKSIDSSGTTLNFGKVEMDQFSIANIPSDSNWFFFHVFFAYLVSFVIFREYYWAFKEYVQMNMEYKLVGKEKKEISWRKLEAVTMRTIMVEEVPQDLGSDVKLKEYFESLGIGEVEMAIMERKSGKEVSMLIEQYKAALKSLEYAYYEWMMRIKQREKQKKSLLPLEQLDDAAKWELRPKMKHPKKTIFSFKREVHVYDTEDTITYYSQLINFLANAIQQKRLLAVERRLYVKPNRELCGRYGFVTFKSQKAAQIAVQSLILSTSNPYRFKVSFAPAPQEVNWDAMGISATRRLVQRNLVTMIFVSFLFFPYTLITSFFKVENLASIPLTRPIAEYILTSFLLTIFVSTMLPPLLISLINQSIIPAIVGRLSSLQAFTSHAKIEMATMSKFYFFLFFNVFFVFTVASGFWIFIDEFSKSPQDAFKSISIIIPAGATFFINYFILAMMSSVLELCRPALILLLVLRRMFSRTPRELYQLNLRSGRLDYGIIYPNYVLIFVIVTTYSVIAPIIILPAILYYTLAWVVWKNQLAYVYVKEWEAYGRHWKMAIKRCIVGLGVSQTVLVGILLSKNATVQAGLVTPLILLSILFYLYIRRAFERQSLYIPLERLMDGTDKIPRVSVEPSPAGSEEDILPAIPDTPMGKEDGHASSGFLEVDLEASNKSLQQRYLDRFAKNYLNPAFSKPLPTPWLPDGFKDVAKLQTPRLSIVRIAEDGNSVIVGPFRSTESLMSSSDGKRRHSFNLLPSFNKHGAKNPVSNLTRTRFFSQPFHLSDQ